MPARNPARFRKHPHVSYKKSILAVRPIYESLQCKFMKKTNVPNGKLRLCHAGKIIRVMKIMSFLILIAFVQVYAVSYSQSTKLNLNYQNVKISDLLDKIEKSSGYRFFYDSQLVNLSKTVSVNSQNSDLKEVLDKVFGSDFTYEMVNDNIVVIKNARISVSDAILTQQQTIKDRKSVV